VARGFESKSVQSQWQDAEARAEERARKRIDPAEHQRRQRRDSLLRSRARVVSDLATARNETHRTSLEHALTHLDKEIAALEDTRPDGN
jgi:hypothetical protein